MNKQIVNGFSNKPTRCIDPVIKYCQGCKYGWVHYPEWVETREDLEDCSFECGCIFGLEDTEPTRKEIREFNREWRKHQRLQNKFVRNFNKQERLEKKKKKKLGIKSIINNSDLPF